jgi:hypothetical protein
VRNKEEPSAAEFIFTENAGAILDLFTNNFAVAS